MQTVRFTEDLEGITAAAETLKAGGVVAIPTETVYGLAASACDDDAIARVFAAKGRPQDNPLIVHISDMDMLSGVAGDIPELALKLASAFWPGPLTMILPKGELVADSVSRGLDTVAVRMPANEVASAVIKTAGLPLAAPSANISGSPSPTSAAHVLSDLDGKIDGVIMSGECTVGVESTVVTLCTEPPRLLRPGFVTAEQLREYIPDLVIDRAVLAEPEKGQKVASPGMKYKHYAPKTEVFLVEGDSAAFAGFVNGRPDSAAICFTEDAEKINIKSLAYGSSYDPDSQAHTLFSLLREADRLGVKAIYVHAPEKTGVGLAVYNRLIRAAAFKVVRL